ncbi:MAG: bifunctional helix-turn-helix transcriptional regulator/GNAT family N-acetyltransferase [candidate division Zixibacteria bacterium]|nr:bifunctional helix-turn-helix transcriptional regulator/GNAT family N-acetyltransferase [candidate division Zixibacteria bacterium]
MDIITQLGPLAFASRLRRLSEHLMKDVTQIYREQAVDFKPRWFPVLYLLNQTSPMSITDIAKDLGLTHPAINQIGGAMLKAGLISSHKDDKDERRRLLGLTAKGRRIASELQPVWDDISSETMNLIRESGMDILAGLDQMELSLAQCGMYDRVRNRIKHRQYAEIEIIAYQPKYKKHFALLNREWLESYFKVEPHDEEMLADPEGRIIQNGGFIFFAKLDDDIVGTAALMKIDDTSFELMKMGVTAKARGKQAGKKLTVTAIEKARESGARTVILHTSPKLKIAERLYRQFGFVDNNGPDDRSARYRRNTISMKLELTNWKYPREENPPEP